MLVGEVYSPRVRGSVEAVGNPALIQLLKSAGWEKKNPVITSNYNVEYVHI